MRKLQQPNLGQTVFDLHEAILRELLARHQPQPEAPMAAVSKCKERRDGGQDQQ